MKVDINRIKTNENKRIRKNNGDIRSLAKSIDKYGLLQPIVISSDFRLIAGYRRLLAAQSLGWKVIEAKMVEHKDKLSLIEIEIDENLMRKDFTHDELKAAYKTRERLLKPNIFLRLLKWLIGLFKK